MTPNAVRSVDAVGDVVSRLRRDVQGSVSDGARRRAEYSTDASNYRVIPSVVVEPLNIDDVVATMAVSRESGVPVTSRGAGTSVAGNAVGTGIVIDFARHLNRIIDIDTQSRTAVVQPGVIMSELQKSLVGQGLRFGPDPSTQNRATLGGMIGNNACGPHAVAYGRTADNVSALTLIDGTGRRIDTRQGLAQVPGLESLIDAHLGIIRTELGTFPRQVSGYSLEHLLPENGRAFAKSLVGTEGTLGVILEATLDLVPISPSRQLVVLGYPDMACAADNVPALLEHHPLAIEGLDARLVDVVRRANGAGSVPDLPAGAGWLMVEVGGSTADEAMASTRALLSDSTALDTLVLPAGPAATAMWQIRADGAGLAGRTPDGRQAWPGWEDAAVPPANLGSYLRDFEALMGSYGVTGLPYGHFGDGCIHVRIDLPLEDGSSVFRKFMFDAAHLVVKHGGSCSGEHGDGRARSELLPIMYSPDALQLFCDVKELFDPRGLMNPGVIVRPANIDADLRRPQAIAVAASDGFSFAHDGGNFTTAVHRCVGVGKCRADNSASGGFMCPSYLATKDEKDVTRGRARVLQELTNGSLIPNWSSKDVHDSLDLCLSCKACARDCPAGVDMAQYKSEVLHRKYRRKLRPVSHYSIGWLPRWLTMINAVPRLGPGLANAVLGVGPVTKVLFRLGGMDTRRSAPRFAAASFHRSARRLRDKPVREGDTANTVLLWVDSFTNGMSPEVADAAAAVLTAAGYRVVVPDELACCGLTWITTGQLTAARKRLLRLLDILAPYADQGFPIVAIEPSCGAVLRSDLLHLLPDDPRAAHVARMTKTLAELLTGKDGTPEEWSGPDLSGVDLIVQPHCHHHSVMGYGTDQELLSKSGATLNVLAGCCGLAGNFGMERGHYEMSVAVAENALLPALKSRNTGSIVLADGFSCRTQIEQLTGLKAMTLAQLLDRRREDAAVAKPTDTHIDHQVRGAPDE